MALGAILAAALTDHSAHPFMLTVAGVDVLKQPGGGYGTPLETIRLTQRGPGGVSELQFQVEDANLAIGFEKGQWVQFRDVANDYDLFAGFVVGWAPEPWEPSGRRVAVRCAGVEKILDWAKVGAFTVAAGTSTQAAVQQAVGNVITGLAAPLRAFGAVTATNGNQDGPIGVLNSAITDPSSALVIPLGTTLREAIRIVCDSSTYGLFASLGISGFLCTVSYDLGLRVYEDITGPGTLGVPNDWGTAVVRTDGAAGEAAANLTYSIDATGPSQVLVIGATASLIVSDGTGRPGDTATLSESSLTTADQMTSAGLSYLGQYVQPARGELDIEAKQFASNQDHPGTKIGITAPELGLSGVGFRVVEIGITFYGTNQNWHVVFGGLAASFASLTRRLTRATLS